MSNKEKLILLNNYKNVLNYVKSFEEEKEEIKEKPKVLVLTKKLNGKQVRVA